MPPALAEDEEPSGDITIPEDPEAIAEHCGRGTVGEEDVRLALNRTFWDTRGVSPCVDPVTPLGFCPKPDKQMMQRLARAVNDKPQPGELVCGWWRGGAGG